jgi:hypothetical protein
LNSTHLGNPSWGRLNLADGTNLIAGIARNTDIVGTFESELDVTNFEELASTFLGVPACSLENLVHKVVCDLKD